MHPVPAPGQALVRFWPESYCKRIDVWSARASFTAKAGPKPTGSPVRGPEALSSNLLRYTAPLIRTYMDVTKSYKFIGFGAMDVTKPHKFIRFGAMDVTIPYTFIRFGTMDVIMPPV